MDVVSLSDIPVGVVHWRAPAPVLTIVVKATVSLEGEGRAELARLQQPLCGDDQTLSAVGELSRASDFAPRKAAVDVLLCGHARAAQPIRQIPFSFAVDDLEVALVCAGDEPAWMRPLLAQHVRRATDPERPVRLAPRPLCVPGWEERALGARFDFAAFNVSEHRVPSLSAHATLQLTGLLDAGTRRLRLPGLWPRVFFVPDRRGGNLDVGERVSVACDTLFIDTDEAWASLTWRGTIPAPADPEARPGAVVVLAEAHRELAWDAVVRELGGRAWAPAMREPEAALPRAFEPPASSEEPTRRHDGTAARTSAGTDVLPPSVSAMARSMDVPSRAPPLAESLASTDVPTLRQHAAEEPTLTRVVPTRRDAPAARRTLKVDAGEVAGSELPRVHIEGEEPEEETLKREPRHLPRPGAATLVTGEAPAMSYDIYAEIKQALSSGRASLNELLVERGLAEHHWHAFERRLASETTDSESVNELRRAILEARKKLSR